MSEKEHLLEAWKNLDVDFLVETGYLTDFEAERIRMRYPEKVCGWGSEPAGQQHQAEF